MFCQLKNKVDIVSNERPIQLSLTFWFPAKPENKKQKTKEKKKENKKERKE